MTSSTTPLPGMLERLGTRVANGMGGFFYFFGELFTTLGRGLVPGRWRRTMREEYARCLYQVGLRAVPAVAIVALLVGLGLVLQLIYWLEFAGQKGRTGEFVVLILARQIAPIVTALIIIGRSGSVLVDEVGQLKLQGYLRSLASHGIDPVDYITIPRAFALASAAFLLTNLFLHTALWSGFMAASLSGYTQIGVLEFIDGVLGVMTLNDHLSLLLKPLLMGFMIGYLSVWYGSRIEPGPRGVRHALPQAFVVSLLATFMIGAILSALL